MCFLTSFLILLLGEEYKFTPYGLISGFLWVSGGICAIFGIRNCGLALSCGVLSALVVLVSFSWGYFVFGESVNSIWETVVGIVLMMFGFIGMTYFSSPRVMTCLLLLEVDQQDAVNTGDHENNLEINNDNDNGNDNDNAILSSNYPITTASSGVREDTTSTTASSYSSNELKEPLLQSRNGLERNHGVQDCLSDSTSRQSGNHANDSNSHTNIINHNYDDNDNDNRELGTTRTITNNNNDSNNGQLLESLIRYNQNNDTDNEGGDVATASNNIVLFMGKRWNRRTLGIMGASMDGILFGLNLVPMHYSSYRGEEYIISFASGAMIVTIIFWILRWGYNSFEQKSFRKGYQALPSMYFKTIIVPASLAGLIWSFGNMGQILSVTYLGESIGMSIVQSSLIVSGIPGILWFKEIRGRRAILLWSISAVITFVGIVLLSRQHKS